MEPSEKSAEMKKLAEQICTKDSGHIDGMEVSPHAAEPSEKRPHASKHKDTINVDVPGGGDGTGGDARVAVALPHERVVPSEIRALVYTVAALLETWTKVRPGASTGMVEAR